MEPFSLAVGIVSVVKDTYRVANFVYMTVKSACNADEERDEIVGNMRQELLFLLSFQSYFQRAHGAIVHSRDLDQVCAYQ